MPILNAMMKIFYAFTCFLTLICAHALAVNNPKQYMIRADSLYRQSQFDSALYYYQAALKMLEPRDTAQKVEIRNDISSIYLRTRQFDLAKPLFGGDPTTG